MAEQIPEGFTAIDWVALQVFMARVGRDGFQSDSVAASPELLEKLTDWAYTMADGFMRAKDKRDQEKHQDSKAAPSNNGAAVVRGHLGG